MTEQEFLRQQQAAAERMRRMHERSRFKEEPPAEQPEAPKPQNKPQTIGAVNSNSLFDRLRDPDSALILGLMLLLFSENADRRLMLALLYILI